VIAFTVFGLPMPQGSKTAYPFQRADGSLGATVAEGSTASRPAFKAWRGDVAACARLWIEANGKPAPLDGPLELLARFYLPRPKSVKRAFPDGKPDLSKLIRAIEDSCSKILYVDDARIVTIITKKRWALTSPPRVEIEIRRETEQ